MTATLVDTKLFHASSQASQLYLEQARSDVQPKAYFMLHSKWCKGERRSFSSFSHRRHPGHLMILTNVHVFL